MAGDAEDEPRTDTLAKDYASFRRMLLDFAAQRHPSYTDTHAADFATTLLELLAYRGDELSYAQDAAAAEAYLDTARRRVSVRRHTRLVDYALHEGRNAVAAVHIAVSAPVTVPTGSRVLSRVGAPLPGTTAPVGAAFDRTALRVDVADWPPVPGSEVFETAYELAADPLGNALRVHHWGEDRFWLDAGATTMWVWADAPGATSGDPRVAAAPPLAAGDLVVVEQVVSPDTGDAADADPAARWLLRLVAVEPGVDPAYRRELTTDAAGRPALQDRTSAADDPLPLLGLRWAPADAPQVPVCVRTQLADGEVVPDVCLVRGNVVLADAGVTVDAVPLPLPPTPDPVAPAARIDVPLRLRLPVAPLTSALGPFDGERRDLSGPPSDARPAIAVTVWPVAGPPEVFGPVADLMDSGPNDLDVVVEVDDTGHGVVRFGDGVLGRRPLDPVAVTARFRVGNGAAGNVGAEALAHVGLPAPDVARVLTVRNPMPATTGTDPEPVEHARRLAPDAYRATQERAVTEQDAVAAVLTVPGVRAAVAALRWTGSWYTWLVSVLPSDPSDLVDTGGTHQELAGSLRDAVAARMDEVRLCGVDVDVRPPQFVAVELALHVCAAPAQSRSALRRAIRTALLGAGLLAASRLTFGRALELGDVYATVAAVPGVDSVSATTLRRYRQPDNGELAAGRLAVAPWEVLRLDDDPSLPSRGVLRLDIDGGTP
jgi:hypothetical protein